jgi:trans-aconitate methyltransferase
VIDYDSELRALHPHLLAAAAVEPGERVLDVGCGAGQSTRDGAAPTRAPRPARLDRGVAFDSCAWVITARRAA